MDHTLLTQNDVVGSICRCCEIHGDLHSLYAHRGQGLDYLQHAHQSLMPCSFSKGRPMLGPQHLGACQTRPAKLRCPNLADLCNLPQGKGTELA